MMNAKWPADVKDCRRHPSADVADHDVYLSFTGDNDAQAFRDWLHDCGWDQYQQYRSEVQR